MADAVQISGSVARVTVRAHQVQTIRTPVTLFVGLMPPMLLWVDALLRGGWL